MQNSTNNIRSKVTCIISIIGFLNKLFSWRGFLITTRISYAIYLTQFPIYFYNVGQTRTAEQYEFFSIMVRRLKKVEFFHFLNYSFYSYIYKVTWLYVIFFNIFLNFVSDKFKRNNVDYFYVHNSYTAVRFTIPKSKKLFTQKTSITKR